MAGRTTPTRTASTRTASTRTASTRTASTRTAPLRTAPGRTRAVLALTTAAALAVTGLTTLTGAAYATTGSSTASTTASTATATTTDSGSPGGVGHRATRRALEEEVRSSGLPGGLVVARQDGHTWAGAAGLGDLRTGEKRSAEDRFRAGSITKTFVATVLLQLEAEGRLDLDDPVEHWLPGLVRGHGHDGRTVTVRQLLNHTSGIFNYTEDEEFGRQILGRGFLRHRYDTWKPEQLVAAAMRNEPYFAPGAGLHYSNTNYILAGLVIEKATGRPYAKEAERRILRPLGLDATEFPGTRTGMPEPSARAYSKLSEPGTPPDPAGRTYDVTRLNPSWGGSAGEIVTDARDLTDFYRALLSGRLLPPRQLAAMTDTIAVPELPGAGYGLGLMRVRLSCGTEVWGHDGGIHGSGSVAVSTRDGRHQLALNFNGDWAGDAMKVTEAEFCGDGRQDPRP